MFKQFYRFKGITKTPEDILGGSLLRKIESKIQKLLLSNGNLGAVLLGVHYAVNVNEYSLNNVIRAVLGGEDNSVSLVLIAIGRIVLSGCQLSSRALTVLGINTDYVVVISEIQSLGILLGSCIEPGNAVIVNECGDCNCILLSGLDGDAIGISLASSSAQSNAMKDSRVIFLASPLSSTLTSISPLAVYRLKYR